MSLPTCHGIPFTNTSNKKEDNRKYSYGIFHTTNVEKDLLLQNQSSISSLTGIPGLQESLPDGAYETQL